MDSLQLIAEMYKRPALWNAHNGEQRSRANLPQLWQEIATCMGPNVTVDECKRKWKNLRDAYRAELKRIEIRIEKDILKGTYDVKNDYGSKWAYFEHMNFIKDIRRPRRSKIGKSFNISSNDTNYDGNEMAEFDDFSDFHDIDDIKPELNTEVNAVTSSLKDDTNDSHVLDGQYSSESEIQQTRKNYNLLQTSNAIKISQDSSKPIKAAEEKPCCKCPKRSFEQMHFLEDLEKQEQNLIKATRLDISRSNELAHVGDSDYNFLVSFLPQLKKMNELQNLQFRAKMTEFVFRIMCETPSASKPK